MILLNLTSLQSVHKLVRSVSIFFGKKNFFGSVFVFTKYLRIELNEWYNTQSNRTERFRISNRSKSNWTRTCKKLNRSWSDFEIPIRNFQKNGSNWTNPSRLAQPEVSEIFERIDRNRFWFTYNFNRDLASLFSPRTDRFGPSWPKK